MSQPLGRTDIIELLVRRKFPPTVLASLSNRPQPKGSTTLGRMLQGEEIARYRSELQNLASDQLQSLYEEAMAAIPDKMIDEIALIGPPDRIKGRLKDWKAASAGGAIGTMLLSAGSVDVLRLAAEAVG